MFQGGQGEHFASISIWGSVQKLIESVAVRGNAKPARHGWRIPALGGLLHCKTHDTIE
jgi:hypothetical protein